MTPLPGAVQSTGLILATVAAAAGLNLGVMSLGQPGGDGTDVATDATPTSADPGLQTLSDTAPAAIGLGAVTTEAPADPVVADPSVAGGASLPAGTGVIPGPPLAAGTSPTGAATTTATPATTATSQSAITQLTSSQAPTTAATALSSPPTSARLTTATTAPRPTTSSTRTPQASIYSYDVSGAGSLTVSVTDTSRLALVSVSDASGWAHTVDTNRADLVKVVFSRRGSEIAVLVALRDGAPIFHEERSNDE